MADADAAARETAQGAEDAGAPASPAVPADAASERTAEDDAHLQLGTAGGEPAPADPPAAAADTALVTHDYRPTHDRGLPCVRGDSLTVLHRDAQWFRVRDAHGQLGWVPRTFLKVSDAPDPAPAPAPSPSPPVRRPRAAAGAQDRLKPEERTRVDEKDNDEDEDDEEAEENEENEEDNDDEEGEEEEEEEPLDYEELRRRNIERNNKKLRELELFGFAIAAKASNKRPPSNNPSRPLSESEPSPFSAISEGPWSSGRRAAEAAAETAAAQGRRRLRLLGRGGGAGR